MEALDNYLIDHYDGHAVQKWLVNNVDIGVYIAAAYLTFVFKGPQLVDFIFRGNPPTRLIKMCWTLWNIGLALFSMYGVYHTVPLFINNLRKYGQKDTLCRFRDDEFYTGKNGVAMGLFSLSKLPEFGDTFFLIMGGKRKLPFLSWFHHVTIFLYAWMAYQQASSIWIVLASINYFVHSIMYTYFALAEAGFKKLVKPFAMYITLLQITQMVVGLYFTFSFISYHKADPKGCNGSTMALARGQCMIYFFNFYLFSEMFIKGYVLPRKAAAGESAAATAPASKKRN
ncbi:beta-ketoacyl-CoA synthase [Leishmania major strain Friedlin]|uniref:Elongation of fatty acids protein n=1 Tax=Leishmania major TaxID=5664 RepID=Q4QFR8_LEIMA|nr:beta-ketoacyl-CoA synthase [Leishmania major strain Friedlin]CAG9571252.1 fatty_acid_elongase_-_putative [Leishmania major strain Friedlin]CAJ02975.1 beta-ketoacyl-CoA synthase [Leishmania major strain Friedlin]|eukprot:XP_001687666.1 beta-ketoacyl-CoA synthase [Leishmania major strain Friedlin]